jgi:predicted Zn-dependent peptidase
LFTIYAGTAPKQTQEVLDLTMAQLEELATKGLTEEELFRGKQQLKGSLILSLESTSSRMNRIGKNELMLGYHYTMDELLDRVDAVTMDDVKKMVDKMLAVPFSVAMVGTNDKPAAQLRRDRFASSIV